MKSSWIKKNNLTRSLKILMQKLVTSKKRKTKNYCRMMAHLN